MKAWRFLFGGLGVVAALWLLNPERAIKPDEPGVVEILYLVEKGRISATSWSALDTALRASNPSIVAAPVDVDIARAIPGISRADVPDMPELVSPIVNVIPMQLLAYYAAVVRGCDVDKPRNLAKSVTVE